jgi:2,3-bisphosphoglycerate-independent phosphoglycerate mutase
MADKLILAIMDGWGVGPADKYNAILNAKTPNVDRLIREYPNTQLKSDGPAVGLEDGSPGTSEVNHLTIGSGRIIWQDLPKINLAIQDKSFFSNKVLNDTVNHAIANRSNIHLIGITSFGGVHSHLDHLSAMLELCKQRNFQGKVYIHAFTDGRDNPPKDAMKDLSTLQARIDEIGIGEVVTLQGRFWLDRDREWARTEKAFELIMHGKGIDVEGWENAITYGYLNHDTCEYFDQYIINKHGTLKKDDAVFFFHYRSDRMFQLTKRILDEKLDNIYFGSFIECSEDFDVQIAFPREKIEGTIAEVLAANKKTQLHITETEKFPHLTYFLDGGREQELAGEKWQLLESNKFVKPQYNFEPSMRAFEISQQVLDAIKDDKFDFIVINFANTDMVGHTGNYNAALIAAEAVDYCIGLIYEAIKDRLNEYSLIVTADHGNAEEMWDYENDQPHTRHTLNKVPFIVVTDKPQLSLRNGRGMDDVAPTVLALMGLKPAEQMRGTTLVMSE